MFINVSVEKKDKYLVDTPGRHIFFISNYSGTINIDIDSINAEVYIYGVYIGRNKDHFKLNTIQHHLSGNNISDLLVKGVFFDESKFIYEGLIRIDKNAQKSNAYQKNQNLIMSPSVFVDSRPFLEILANDVRCTHGSTTGKLDQDQLYYLQSRGISPQYAKRALINGFVEDIFLQLQKIDDRIPISNIKANCLNYLNN